ncbi:hypothetical protein KR084_005248, partial [Drosophila pseudotakahashii]
TGPAGKRLRNNTGGANERLSDAVSSQMMALLKVHLQEQTEQMSTCVREAEQRILDGLSKCLDLISDEVKRSAERVTSLELEVADLRSHRDQLRERMDRLEREVGELRILRERVGGVETKLSAQHIANNACDLRLHGVPFQEGENLRTLFNQLCFSLKLTPPPRIRVIYRAQKQQNSIVDPVVLIK